MEERSRVVISTIATVAAMTVLLVGPGVSAEEPANRPPPAELTGR